MEPEYPSSWAGLRYPWQRRELILYLEELTAPDPRKKWEQERSEGRISNIDQVIHFFFDDHEFDASDVGANLLDAHEVELVQGVKAALDAIVRALPRGGDDEFVEHALWLEVTKAAKIAHRALAGR